MHPSHSSHGSVSLGTFLAPNTLKTEEGGRALLTFHRFTARTSGARGIPRARHSRRERTGNPSWQGDFPQRDRLPCASHSFLPAQIAGNRRRVENSGASEIRDLASRLQQNPSAHPRCPGAPGRTELLNPDWECGGWGGKPKENK